MPTASPSLFDDAGDDTPTFAGPYAVPSGVAVPPRDPKVGADEAPRLSRQCVAILDRLRRGRASNAELATIALEYGGRISDLRAAGFTIKCIEQDRKTGYAVYALFEGGVEVAPPSVCDTGGSS